MERALLRLPGFESVRLFGIRHLSPAGAFHAERIIEELRPDCLLLELPADTRQLLPALLDPETIPPVAIVSWGGASGEASVLPLAGFSPELRALKRAAGLGAEIRFIDLPSGIYLSMPEDSDRYENQTAFDGDWETGFEHGDTDAYLDGIRTLSEAAAGIAGGALSDLRERHMRREIERAASDGFRRILVVAGAFHLARLAGTAPAGDIPTPLPPDAECVLIPYSYDRLGVAAPGYFAMLYDCLAHGGLENLPERYLSELAAKIRAEGNLCPSGSVIDAARLARSLASVRGRPRPGLDELREAAVCCMGRGDALSVARAVRTVEIGQARGFAPGTAARLPLAADFERHVRALRLERFLAPEPAGLTLDLRRMRGESKLAVERSSFLRRLALLGSSFARLTSGGDAPLHAEKWRLRWSPEVETHFAGLAHLGATIECAAANTILEACSAPAELDEALSLVETVLLCGLSECVPGTLQALQAAVTASRDFTRCASAAGRINRLVARLSISERAEPGLAGILRQLRLRCIVLLPEAAECDYLAARAVASGLNLLFDSMTQREGRFVRALKGLAHGGETNPYLSGLALAQLMELGEASDAALEAETRKRLSVGDDPGRAALWFEGMLSRNLYALLLNRVFITTLESFVASLENADFIRALPALRRAFSSLEPGARESVAMSLEEIWSPGREAGDTFLLDRLNEFDVGELL